MRLDIPGLGVRPLRSQDTLPDIYLCTDTFSVHFSDLEESNPVLLHVFLPGPVLCGPLLWHLR